MRTALSILIPKIYSDSRAEGAHVLGGGIIPDEDIPALKDVGIAEIFGPGTNTEQIINYINDNLRR